MRAKVGMRFRACESAFPTGASSYLRAAQASQSAESLIHWGDIVSAQLPLERHFRTAFFKEPHEFLDALSWDDRIDSSLGYGARISGQIHFFPSSRRRALVATVRGAKHLSGSSNIYRVEADVRPVGIPQRENLSGSRS